MLAWLVLSSLLGVVLNQLLFVKGLSYTTAINATLLTTTIPVFTLVVSIALGYDRASLRHILGMRWRLPELSIWSIPGALDFQRANNARKSSDRCQLLSYGAYIAVSRDLFRRYGALNVITWIFLMGALITLPFAGYAWSTRRLEQLFRQRLAGDRLHHSGADCRRLLPKLLGTHARVTPSIVAIYIYLQPLLAFGLAPLVLGESWNSRTLVACVLIFAGVAVVTIRAAAARLRKFQNIRMRWRTENRVASSE